MPFGPKRCFGSCGFCLSAFGLSAFCVCVCPCLMASPSDYQRADGWNVVLGTFTLNDWEWVRFGYEVLEEANELARHRVCQVLSSVSAAWRWGVLASARMAVYARHRHDIDMERESQINQQAELVMRLEQGFEQDMGRWENARSKQFHCHKIANIVGIFVLLDRRMSLGTWDIGTHRMSLT